MSNLPYDIAIVSSPYSTSWDDTLIAPHTNNQIALTVIHAIKGKRTQFLKGHLEPVTSLVYRKFHQQIISASKDGSMLVWCPTLTETVEERQQVIPTSSHTTDRQSSYGSGSNSQQSDIRAVRSTSVGFVPPIIHNYLNN